MASYELIIIGGGGVGFAAAMYSGRFKLKTAVFTGDLIGGLITWTDDVSNYPGIKKATGPELAKMLEDHAREYDIDVFNESVAGIKKTKDGFEVKADGKAYKSKAILFATGTTVKKLGVKGERELMNRGVHFCALCLPIDESVIANSSIKKIKDVTPLTRVLTIDGTFQEIEGFTKSKYNGELIKIKPRYFTEPVLLTSNHPVYCVNIHKKYHSKGNKSITFSNPEWKEAGSLKEGDCVLYPIIKESINIDSIRISDYIEVQKQDDGSILPLVQTFTSVPLKDIIPINNDFLRLVGYYLAEGSSCKHTLKLYFNKNEATYINDVKMIIENIFKLNVDIRYIDNVCHISVYSKVLSSLFKLLFNEYSYKKSLPHWMMVLPKEKQSEIVRGMWRGDGCLRDKDFTYVTCSRNLAYQLRDLLLRQGIICSLQIRDKRGLNRVQNKIEGKIVGFNHDKYHLSVGGQFLNKMSNLLDVKHPYILSNKNICNEHAWLRENYAILPIREIIAQHYEGDVLNLGVKGNNTYIAKNFIVHNCDGVFYTGKTIAVIGGSDSAGKDALVMTQYANKVYIIYRGDKIHPEPVNYEKIKSNKKIEIITNTNIIALNGKDRLESVTLDKPYKNKKELKLDGIFVAIGHQPNSDLAKKLGVKLNKKNEIIINRESKTNIPGVFAAGDVVDTRFKQLITGVGEAVSAVYSAYEYLSKK